MERTQKLMPWLPLATLAIASFSLFIFCVPDMLAQAVYSRQAVLNGEVWRILTAPLAHFTASHLLWDISIFTVFGTMLERTDRLPLLKICAGTALLSGLAYLLFAPDLAYYGGLSGTASAIVAYLCLDNVRSNTKCKRLWQLLLLLLILKLAVELITSTPVFVSVDTSQFTVLPSAHLMGIVVAFTCWLWELRETLPGHSMALKRLGH